MARASPATRKSHVIFACPRSKCVGCVLTSPVRMKDTPFSNVSSAFGHLKRRDHQRGSKRARKRPADYHSGIQINHYGKIEPTLLGFKIGNISYKLIGGNRTREITSYEVFSFFCIRILNGGLFLGDRTNSFT